VTPAAVTISREALDRLARRVADRHPGITVWQDDLAADLQAVGIEVKRTAEERLAEMEAQRAAFGEAFVAWRRRPFTDPNTEVGALTGLICEHFPETRDAR
jgi:uncharacterized protein involved in exopolysaccharide biosynthesis